MSDASNGDEIRQQLIDSQLATLSARFPDLTADQQAEIRTRLGADYDLAARLRSQPLTNADEPEIVFRPHPAREP